MSDDKKGSPLASPPADVQPHPEIENDHLLTLQTAKAELVQQRDALLAKRTDLVAGIERLQQTWEQYQTTSRQNETKKKLEYYLRQNDYEHEKRLAGEDEVASFVLDNMHVLPSSDWLKRMDLIGRFYPHMKIVGALLNNIHDPDGRLLTEISFVLQARGLPSLHIVLSVRDEKVVAIKILQSEKTSLVLNRISPSYAQILTSEYAHLGKIDILVYSYHSLATMQARRISTLLKILQQYAQNRLRPGAEWEADPFDSLKTIPYVEFEFIHSKTSASFLVRLYWKLVLNESSLGHVSSELEFTAIRKETQEVVRGANNAFLNLLPEYGVCKAFELIIKNIF